MQYIIFSKGLNVLESIILWWYVIYTHILGHIVCVINTLDYLRSAAREFNPKAQMN